MKLRVLGAAASLVTLAIAACVGSDPQGDSPSDGTEPTSDGGTGGAKGNDGEGGGPLTEAFALAVDPGRAIIEPGSIVPIVVSVVRRSGFDEPIELTLRNAPSSVTGTATIGTNENTATMNVGAPTSAAAGQLATAEIHAESTVTHQVASKSLELRIGHLLFVADQSGTFTIPNDVVEPVVLAAWGSGGGAGGQATAGTASALGGAGGGGGFAQGEFVLPKGTQIELVVGQGGYGGASASSPTNANAWGGGGGGYTAVRLPDGGVLDGGAPDAGSLGAYLVVVGSGGGATGADAHYCSGNAQCGPAISDAQPGVTGGPGSGGAGGDGAGTSAGKGGKLDGGGAGTTLAQAGGSFAGGSATSGTDGGAPGGGRSDLVYSGGGAGRWGGGAGVGGGGGGAGYVAPSATNVEVVTATGNVAAKTTHPYYGNNAGVGGAPAAGAAGGKGAPGRIVIYAK